MKSNESWFDLFMYCRDQYLCQVIIRRRSSRAFMCSSMSISSICLYIEEIIFRVKSLLEEEVAECLCSVKLALVRYVYILKRSLLVSSYYWKKK